MRLYKLGKVAWQESQLIYHALAHLGWEALSLVSPDSPYVCIGFHQDVAQEVDLEYCNANSIPVFRRDLGGGAVYLDGNQLFFHLILRKDNPQIPKKKEAFYRKFLSPVINTYRRIGIPAEYRPVNDIVTGTRKISGTGVGEIGECVVFVGNLIVDFNYEQMSRVLRVPDEKFRDKVKSTLKDNLSTIRRELGDEAASKWDNDTLNALMAEEFQKLLGQMMPEEKEPELQRKMDELGTKMMTDQWLFRKGRKIAGRDIKIRSGIKVVHKMYKAPGGLLRADFEVRDGRFQNVSISGDFFCFPEEAVEGLETRLEGQPTLEALNVVKAVYAEGIEIPGVEIEHWARVLEA